MLHVSDIHLPVTPGLVSPRALAHPKRLIGWLNYRLRRKRAFVKAGCRLEQLAEFARARRPDVILFTGDVCSLGTDAELARFRRLLQPLVACSPRFVCLPGNHDIYTGRTPWRRHFGDLSPHTGEDSAWPRECALDDGVTLFLLDSTRPLQTPLSNGRVPGPVLERLVRRLDACGGFRFVVMHHGPWRASGRADTRLHGLTNARALLACLRGRTHSALLHGHLHQGYCLCRTGFPPVFCAGSATEEGRAGGWEFELDQAERTALRFRYRDGAYRVAAQRVALDGRSTQS